MEYTPVIYRTNEYGITKFHSLASGYTTTLLTMTFYDIHINDSQKVNEWLFIEYDNFKNIYKQGIIHLYTRPWGKKVGEADIYLEDIHDYQTFEKKIQNKMTNFLDSSITKEAIQKIYENFKSRYNHIADMCGGRLSTFYLGA